MYVVVAFSKRGMTMLMVFDVDGFVDLVTFEFYVYNVIKKQPFGRSRSLKSNNRRAD